MKGRFEITFDQNGAAWFFESPNNASALNLLEEMLWGLCQTLNTGHLPSMLISLNNAPAYPRTGMGRGADPFDPKAMVAMARQMPGMAGTFLTVVAYSNIEDAKKGLPDEDGDFLKGFPVIVMASLLPERVTA